MVLEEGLVFASDSRTNAGVDHVSIFCKMTVVETPGQGVIVLLNSGNLATTQQVVSRIKQQAIDSQKPLTSHASMFSVAELVGSELRKTIHTAVNEAPEQSDVDFSASTPKTPTSEIYAADGAKVCVKCSGNYPIRIG